MEERVRELEWEVKELKESQINGGNTQKILDLAKEVKEINRVPLPDSFTSIEFILQETGKGTLYAGDWENK